MVCALLRSYTLSRLTGADRWTFGARRDRGPVAGNLSANNGDVLRTAAVAIDA
jgi:hypothetical protein